MQDLIIIICIAIFALMGHGAKKKRWLEWVVRIVIGLWCYLEAQYILLGMTIVEQRHDWYYHIIVSMCVASSLTLLYIFRSFLSYLLTAIQSLVSLHFFIALFRKTRHQTASWISERVLVPSSIPHMVGLFVYISAFFYLLSGMHPSEFEWPGLPIPLPIQLDQLVAYNGFGLIMLAFCGVGIYVSRKPKEAMQRLALFKPTLPQVGIGIALILFSFLYDDIWARFTHQAAGSLASKLAMYNSGTFAINGGFTAAIIIALATAICAGLGEEILMRGALQPALGILPAAILHGMLHGQFMHTPILIVQIAIWSIVMGIVKHYTNTTTTIIGHAGFNFLSTFLFAFNP